ncbi:hypothetical protein AB5I41_03455 [Sphingomonas sp. MMS24-JH45]
MTAFEYADLNNRGRFGVDLPLGPILGALEKLRFSIFRLPHGH